MTDENSKIVERLESEWQELAAGIRQEKLEAMFMKVLEASSQLTDSERAEALALHDETDRDFLAAIEGLTEAQWVFRPGLNRWSIQEAAEHAILVAEWLGSGLEQALSQPPDPALTEPPGLYDKMKIRVLDRSVRGIQAPPPVSPRNHWTIEETLARFREIRSRARALLFNPDLPLKSTIFSSMPGTFNCYHWLVLISLHTR